MTATPTPTPDPDLDGLRPRQAACEHCGYHFNAAIPIRGGTIRCPECGMSTVFSFDRMAADRARRAAATRARLMWGLLLPAAIAAAGLAIIRASGGGAGGLGMLLGTVATSLAVIGVVRLWLLRRGP